MLQIGNVRSRGIGHVRLVMRSTNAVSVVDSLKMLRARPTLLHS